VACYPGRSMCLCMQDYKSLCPAVTVCDTLVNRRTDVIQTVYTISYSIGGLVVLEVTSHYFSTALYNRLSSEVSTASETTIAYGVMSVKSVSALVRRKYGIVIGMYTQEKMVVSTVVKGLLHVAAARAVCVVQRVAATAMLVKSWTWKQPT